MQCGMLVSQHVSLSRHVLLCSKWVLEGVPHELLSNKGRLVVAIVDDEGSEEVWDRLNTFNCDGSQLDGWWKLFE
jgi:hypothetical protein